jgi:hypothetical protein
MLTMNCFLGSSRRLIILASESSTCTAAYDSKTALARVRQRPVLSHVLRFSVSSIRSLYDCQAKAKLGLVSLQSITPWSARRAKRIVQRFCSRAGRLYPDNSPSVACTFGNWGNRSQPLFLHIKCQHYVAGLRQCSPFPVTQWD